ncbi:MAG: hypothetical protein ACREI8_05415 [Myxococcota bacterium]
MFDRLVTASHFSLLVAAIALLAPLTGRAQPAVVGPTKPVLVVNSPAEPVPVDGTVSVEGPVTVTDADNPAFQPFQNEELFSIPAGSLGDDESFTVPSGKRLVIEFVSFKLVVPTGQKPTFNWVRINGSTGSVDFFFPLTVQATGDLIGGVNSDIFIGSSETRLYADPGSTVGLSVRRDADVSTGSASVSVSGHLVDLP